MVYGRGSIQRGENQLEWWICYDKYPGPYAEPDFVAQVVADEFVRDFKNTKPFVPVTRYDIDKSRLKQMSFDSYKDYNPGDVIVFDGEPYGWVISVMRDRTHSTTLEYQPY